MSAKIMHLDNLYDFSLVRFEPNSIILIDKNSRKPYEFYQLGEAANIRPQIQHQYMLRPILYKNGVLYEKGCQNLASLLQSRRRDYNPVRYSIEELVNTFQPLLECLEYLHRLGVVYGNLGAEHVVFYEDGAIRVKDWLFKAEDQVQANQLSKKADMKNLGYILASAASLMPESELHKLSSPQIASILLQSYSLSFCAAVLILLEGVSKYNPLIMGLISSQNEPKLSEIKAFLDEAIEIKNVREREKVRAQESSRKEKLLKDVENEKAAKVETPRKQEQKGQNTLMLTGSLQGSPTKKFNITTPNKKIIRLEDCENKKVFNEQVKKRQIQKITKIIQRSNAFVNELMARKNNDRKYLNAAKVNSSMVQPQNPKKVVYLKESPKISSPAKRLRSISKKK